MLGRRKESALLLIVLALSFLLSSALAIILPSTQAAAQLSRERTYGSWQVMLVGRTENECEELIAALPDDVEAAQMPAIRGASDETISVMTPELMKLGNFGLLDGRLPEAEDEILIVEEQFAAGQRPQVGDRVTVAYQWGVQSTKSSSFARRQMELRDAAIYEALETLMPERLEEYYAYVEQLKEALETHDPYVQTTYWDLTQYSISHWGESVDPEDMTPEQLEQSFMSYLSKYTPDKPMSISEMTTVEPVLVPCEGYGLTLLCSERKQMLNGAVFGEKNGQTFTLTHEYTGMSANVPYTVCGVIKAYEATWDAGGYDLPDAFLSEAGYAVLQENLDFAEEFVDDLMVYRTSEESCLLRSERSLAELYEVVAEADRSIERGHYDLYQNTADMTGLPYDTVEFWGWDPEIGMVERDGIWEMDDTGLSWYTFPDVLDENGQPLRFSEADYTDGFVFPGLERIPEEPYYPPLEELYQKNESPNRFNSYAFPDAAATASSATGTVLNAILALISACAVLVICVVQSKRRAHALVLLRSIGLQNGQAAGMQLTEAGLFLVLSLVIGLPLGYLAAYAGMHWYYHGEILAADVQFLLRSALCAAVSLVVGLQIPLLYSLRLPLTGKSSIAAKKPPKRGALRRGTLFDMERAAARFNRRRDLLARMLCALALLLALLTLLLAHFAFDSYRLNVERADLPDYVLTATFGMKQRFFEEKMETYSQPDELGEAPSRIDAYLVAENVTISGCEDSPVISYLNGLVRIAGMTEDNALLQRLLEYTGPIDLNKLRSGEGCIVLMPYYHSLRSGTMEFSADAVDAYRFSTDDSIQAGDILHLSAESHSVHELGVVTRTTNVDVEVLAVLHEYPDVWLFGGSAQPGVLISGQNLVTAVYPNAKQRYSPDEARWQAASGAAMHCTYCKGSTVFQFHASDAGDHTTTYWNLAQEEGLSFKSNYREKLERYAVSENQRTMTLLLGAAAVLLVLVILLFILSDMAEQERRRIGILRAIGASKGGIRGAHVCLAMREGLRTLGLANAAFALVLLGCAFVKTGFHTLSPAALVSTLSEGLLWKYPWKIHLLICLGAWLATTLLRALPYRRLCKMSVIATIKGLERGE